MFETTQICVRLICPGKNNNYSRRAHLLLVPYFIIAFSGVAVAPTSYMYCIYMIYYFVKSLSWPLDIHGPKLSLYRNVFLLQYCVQKYRV
jgi:hypothetical protein